LGETAADTQREIEEIRKDVLSATRELEHRVTRAASPRTYVQAAREHPASVAGIVLVGLAAGGVLIAREIIERRRRNRPTERLRRTVHGVAEGLGEQLERAREALPTSVPIGLRIGSGDQEEKQTTQLQVPGSQPHMLKRILWAGLVAAMMAGGGLLARRLSAFIWQQAMREKPPTTNV
jgi:hypothetical protein